MSNNVPFINITVNNSGITTLFKIHKDNLVSTDDDLYTFMSKREFKELDWAAMLPLLVFILSVFMIPVLFYDFWFLLIFPLANIVGIVLCNIVGKIVKKYYKPKDEETK